MKNLSILFVAFLLIQINTLAQDGWFQQTSGTTEWLHGVSFTDSDNGTAVGNIGTILRTTDGGTNWTSQPSGTTENLRGVSFTDSDNGTAVGENGTILRTINGGSTWASQTSGTTEHLMSVSFTDSDYGTAVGEGGTILRTTNGGTIWITQTSGTTYNLNCVSFTDANYGTVVGYNWPNYFVLILRTTDGGTTWTSQTSGTTRELFGVSFTDTNNGTAVGGYPAFHQAQTIIRTTNGGTIWITQTSGTPFSLFGVSFTDANYGTAVGTGGLILRTTNGGSDWTPQTSGTSEGLIGVSFTDSDNGTAVGSNGTILRTTTGGVIPVELTAFTASTSQGKVYLNWTTATEINNLGFEVERKIINNNKESEWVRIGFREGYSTTTEPKEYSYVDDISSITATSLAYRLKQIDFDGSYEYSDVVEVILNVPTEYSLQQNFPNPFNPTTTIGFGLQIKSNVKIIILNAIGEEVAVLVNEEKEAGFHQVEFNATNLPSGVYFYRIQAGSFIETKKMVLLK